MTTHKYALFTVFVFGVLFLLKAEPVLSQDLDGGCIQKTFNCNGRLVQGDCDANYADVCGGGNSGYVSDNGDDNYNTLPTSKELAMEAYDKGNGFYRKGNWIEAKRSYLHALGLYSNFTGDIFFKLGHVFENLRSYNEALSQYEKAMHLGFYSISDGKNDIERMEDIVKNLEKAEQQRKEFPYDKRELMDMLGSGKPRATDVWEQLNYGLCILGNAVDFARIGDKSPIQIDYFREMSKQAANAFDGARVHVQCPDDFKPPGRPYGIDSSAPLERFGKALLKATESEVTKRDTAEKRISRAIRKKKRLTRQSNEKNNKIVRLKEELAQIGLFREQESSPAQSQAKEAKKSAKAIALAALKSAQIALKKVQQEEKRVKTLILSEQAKKARANANLNQFENMFNQVRNDPGKAQTFLGKIER